MERSGIITSGRTRGSTTTLAMRVLVQRWKMAGWHVLQAAEPAYFSCAAAENMLAAHDDLAGMFASAEPSSVGAALAIKARGLADKVNLVAFDSTEGMVEDLKTGAIDAMVVQDPFKMGYMAVKTQVDHLHGITPAKRIDLSARVITKPDLDKPDVKELPFSDLDKYLK